MHQPITVTASELRQIATAEETSPRYEARTNTTGEWSPVNAWSVISETAAGHVRHTYSVRTPGEALAAFMGEAARRKGLGFANRIIPDPECYTQEIRIVT